MPARSSFFRVLKISKSSRSVLLVIVTFAVYHVTVTEPRIQYQKTNRLSSKNREIINPQAKFKRTPSWPYTKNNKNTAINNVNAVKLDPKKDFVRTPSWPY